MYTPTQLEIIKIFEDPQRKLDKQIIKMRYGTCISHKLDEVHLEDIFRVAEEKDIKIGIGYGYGGLYITDYHGDEIFLYDPTIPVLEQPEETLQQLISLFK